MSNGARRSRRTLLQVIQLEEQIYDVLAEDHPQSVRHVFYRMTDPRLPEPVSKSEAGYRQIQYRLTALRRSGRIPYGWITDATRRGYHTVTYGNGGDFLRRTNGLYRADLWSYSDSYCEVWCESRSIAGVIQNDCEELAVSLYPAGGFASLSLVYQAAENIAQELDYTGKDAAHIVYVGDFDPAGVLIDQSIESELRKHLPTDLDLHFNRIAINEHQIEAYDLPTKPRKEGDKRSRQVLSTVEAEAMPAAELRLLVRRSIESMLPAGALHATRIAEESEREGLELLAGAVEQQGLSTVVDKIGALA